MLVMGLDKPREPKTCLTNTGVTHTYLPSSVLHGPYCLSRDFTWSGYNLLFISRPVK